MAGFGSSFGVGLSGFSFGFFRAASSGYQILMKQSTPPEEWLENARSELIRVYEGLGEPARAEQFRREQKAKGR